MLYFQFVHMYLWKLWHPCFEFVVECFGYIQQDVTALSLRVSTPTRKKVQLVHVLRTTGHG